MTLHPSLFREYDIRGVVGKTLDEAALYAIAQRFAENVRSQNGRTVALGYDGRISSPAFADSARKGLVDAGMEVLEIGLCPTPMLYFASKTLHADGAMMITGSHNPPDHNGVKFVLGNQPFYGEQIRALRTLQPSTGHAPGAARKVAVMEEYLVALCKEMTPSMKNLHVAWDCGHGAAGAVVPLLCARLPGTHALLFERVDGSFPAHHPDPTVAENLLDLQEYVRAHGCDLGVAFDGDGDRVGVVDDEGEILWGDQLLMLLSREVLAAQPGATIIADVKASQSLFDEVTRLGGNALMWKTGHSLIKAKMAETKAPLAGEMSGHVFFADRYYGFDDGIYAAMRMIGLVARAGVKLSSLRKGLPKTVATPEIRFECEDARKFAVIQEVAARLKNQGAGFSDVDGVRVKTHSGWWLLRASNTQAMLVARAEGPDAAALEALKEDLRHQLALSNVALP